MELLMNKEALKQGKIDYVTPIQAVSMQKSVQDSIQCRAEVEGVTIDDVKAKNISYEKFCNSVHQTTCYAIFFVLYEVHDAVNQMVAFCKAHRLYKGIGGYKRELTRLEQFHSQVIAREHIVEGSYANRINRMCEMSHQDLAMNTMRIRLTVSNKFKQVGFEEADLLAPIETAYIITEFATKYITARCDEGVQYSPALKDMKCLAPNRLLGVITKFYDFVISLKGVGEPEVDLNKSKELHTGVRIIDKYCTDIVRMSKITLTVLEEEYGREWLKNYDIEGYYSIHPEEEPAEETQEEQKPAPAVEPAKEIKEHQPSIAEMLQSKGWRIKK